MRTFTFAKRNLKEIIRDPLSLIFCIIFPIALLLLLELIVTNTGVDFNLVPQFKINNLTAAISVFGFSFITLFCSMLISKDRTTSFQARLNSSPMRPIDFICGYSLPMFVIAFVQAILTFAFCFIFGLQFNVNLLMAFVALIPSALLFIGFGLLIGTVFNDKSSSGVSSIIVNLAAILGGMFFPLETMTGAFVTITNILPFSPALKLVSCALNGNYSGMLIPLATVMAYVVVVFAIAIFVFYKKMKSDKR